MPKISIVTAYYNRRDLLEVTLKSIQRSKHKDIELIVVDDGSDEDHRLEHVALQYPFMRVIRQEPKDKWYINPCIPFNIGFNAAQGEIILMQNPECYHVGDILTHIAKNIQDKDYFTYSCYSLDKSASEKLANHTEDHKLLMNLPNRLIPACGELGWYNHPTLRPCAFHFASAIKRQHMQELGGFDERYANGIAYDDNELLIRIKRYGMNVHIIKSPMVLHQWHYTPKSWTQMNSRRPILEKHNADIFRNKTLKENTWKANQ